MPSIHSNCRAGSSSLRLRSNMGCREREDDPWLGSIMSVYPIKAKNLIQWTAWPITLWTLSYLLTAGVNLSSARSLSPCSKNSLVTSSATLEINIMQLLLNHVLVRLQAARVVLASLNLLNLNHFHNENWEQAQFLGFSAWKHQSKQISPNYFISRQANGLRTDVNANKTPRPV